MKCPNCNNENAEENKFCVHCGTPLTQKETVEEQPVVEETKVEQQVQENVESQPVVEQPVVEQTTEEPQQPVKPQQYSAAPKAKTAQASQKSQRRSLISILALIAVVAVVAILGIILLGGGSKKLYKTTIKKGIEETLLNSSFDAKVIKANATIELSSTDKTYKDIDGIKADVELQYNLKNEQAIVKVNAEQGEEGYLNLDAFVDLTEGKVYANEKNIYSKTIEADIPDEYVNEIKETLKLDELKENSTSKERRAVAKTLISALNDNITVGKFSKKNVKIEVDGKNKSVEDNILTFKPSQLKAFFEGFSKTIEKDKDFVKNVEAIFGDDINIEDMLDEINDIAKRLEGAKDEGNAIEFHYYTYGLGNSFAGFSALVISGDEISESFEVMMTSKNTYKVSINDGYDEQELISFKVNKLNSNNIDVEVDLTSVGMPIIARVKAKSKNIKSIDNFDTSKAVNIEDMTDEDLEEIEENLEKSPLYSLIENSEDVLTNGFEFDLDYDNNDVDDDTPKKGYGEPYVESYSDDIRVNYTVPDEFEETEYSDNNYRIYQKESGYDYATINTYISYDKAKDHIEELLDYDYLNDDPDFYHDIKISSPKLEKINGREYYTATVEYGFGSNGLKAYTKVYVTQITDEYCYVVEMDDDDRILKETEINDFLNITVK